MTETPKHLKVFKPLTVSTNLPYSIKRGEYFAIPIVVFNSMFEDVTAEVTLHNDEQEFEFADMSNKNNKAQSILILIYKKLDFLIYIKFLNSQNSNERNKFQLKQQMELLYHL